MLLRLSLQRGLRLTHNYQPNPFLQTLTFDPRASRERFLAVDAVLSYIKNPSVLDIGCNQGFFTLSFAKKGGICLGIDNDRAELMAARSLAVSQNMRNVAFLELTLDQENIASLPRSDIVICLSIFHHWVRHYGQSGAEEMLSALAEKAGKVMVFDSGQPEETTTSWCQSLGFMKPSGAVWIASHLKSLGFTKVIEVGGFPTGLSPIPRSLFVASR